MINRRVRKEFLVVLDIYVSNPFKKITGYEIMITTGLKSGTVYPMLLRMEKAGWLCSEREEIDYSRPHRNRPPRKFFRITNRGLKAGRKLLAEKRGGRR